METKTFRIPAPKLHSFQKKIKAWDRKAQKSGLGELQFSISEETTKEHLVVYEVSNLDSNLFKTMLLEDWGDGSGFPTCKFVAYETREYYDVTLPTELPSFDGYEFVAVIDHAPATGNVICQVSNEIEIPAQYRNSNADCDHCKTNRRRHTTLILKGEDGTFHQIGKTCVKLYLNADVGSLVAMAEMWPDMFIIDDTFGMDDEEWFGVGGIRGEATLNYLCNVAYCIRNRGYSPKSNNDEPTSGQALDSYIRPTAEDIKTAEDALQWAQALEPTSTFRSNVKVLSHEPITTFKAMGFVAWIVQGYLQEQHKKEVAAQPKSTSYIGDVNTNVSFTGTVVKYWVADEMNKYEVYPARVEIVTESGLRAVWWTSVGVRALSLVTDVGTIVEVSGQVKNHQTFQNQCQTIISRPKFTVLKEATE